MYIYTSIYIYIYIYIYIGFDYGLATLGIALAKWRVGDVDAVEGLRDDVDAPGDLINNKIKIKTKKKIYIYKN
jgi:hypothetical protein